MAYAALISLANTIDRILNYSEYSISRHAKQQVTSLLNHVTYFQAFLKNFPDKYNSLEGRMRELANEAEDIIEYFMLEQVSLDKFNSSEGKMWNIFDFFSISEQVSRDKSSSSKAEDMIGYSMLEQVSSCSNVESEDEEPELQLEKVIEEIDLIAGEVKKVIKDISTTKDVQRGAVDSSAPSSSSSAPTTREDAVVSFEDYVIDVKDRLCGESSKLQVIPICGMGGIGKTTLAKHVYDDSLIVHKFEVRVWVTISQEYSAQRILSSLLESLKGFCIGVSGESDKDKVYKILKWRRYLVVMDDIWTSEAWDVVRKVFPDDGNGSRILLTTRLSDVASYPDPSSRLCAMRLMDADQSWNLLKKKVFKDEDCPSELENIGKKIARNCKGLPLATVVIAGLVSTVSQNPSSWQEIADKVKSADSAEHGQIEEILSLSYTHLPQHLRACFLYMSSFPEDHEINVTRLIRLWIAEGFVECPECLEKKAEECLEDLVKRSLVVVTKRKSDGRIKRCSLHDLVRDLCISKARESKFLLNLCMDMNIKKKRFIESIKNERRVSLDSSSLTYLSSSAIHTIMCWRYRLVKLDFVKGVRLLRVLDAEPTVVDSPLPAELFELFHLRYLAIRYSHSILGISKLQNLQTLIIRREKRISIFRTRLATLSLPWSLPQLRHVYFVGTIYFRDPKGTNCSLQNLQTLSKVDGRSCTEWILKKIPNLKKIKVNCSGGGDEVKNLVHLHRLENLKLVGCHIDFMFTLPATLKKLSLDGLEIPWKSLGIVIGSLPNLQVLKLKNRACDGSTWETSDGEFPRLEFLLILYSYLENWITESSHFPRLKRLMLHSCWYLNEIPSAIGEIPTLELIEVIGDGNTPLKESAWRIREEQEDLGNDALQVHCYNSSIMTMF